MKFKKIFNKIIKKSASALGFDIIRRDKGNYIDQRVVTLAPGTAAKGNVLLGFIIEPFLRESGEPISNAHSHDRESFKMAETFLEMGYCVDVISYRNSTFIPRKPYSIFVAARTNFERIARLLDDSCIKIVHQDTAHWLFNNHAAYSRLLALQERRGLTLYSARIVEPNWAVEYADYITILGNQFTIDTYKYAGKEIYRIPISVPAIYPWPEDRDMEACCKNYVWFGSSGFVHKGLDLVLEAFLDMPDYHLTICGPLDQDAAFQKAFHKELYETPNIHTVGWVDIESEHFLNITRNCIGLIYPSCAEGGGGSALTCMHAGLIPVVSYETSIDVDDFGIVLRENTIAEIKSTIKSLSALPKHDLLKRARLAWEYARNNHTRERFADIYKKTIDIIINESRKSQGGG